MLKRLHRQFVILSMLLVGLVLAGAMGMSLSSSYLTQQELIQNALTNTLRIANDAAAHGTNGVPLEEPERTASMLTAALTLKPDGTITDYTTSIDKLGREDIEETIEDVLHRNMRAGAFTDRNLRWDSYKDADGTYTIAFVETSVMDEAFSRQLVSAFFIFLGSMAALFFISWHFCAWMLRPVQKSWDSQKRFIADASHELKTPLAVILANCQILDSLNDMPADARRWVDSTTEEAEQMSELVTDLLTLARAEEASSLAIVPSASQFEPVDLSDIADEAVLEFDPVAYERGCMIEAKIVPGLCVSADAAALKRLSKILLDNATKYATKKTAVEVSLRPEREQVVFSVTNQGTPIDPADLPHVFERFYRSDRARSRGTSSFGLGLAIARSTVESFGGTISVASDAAHGTTFTVRLPETHRHVREP